MQNISIGLKSFISRNKLLISGKYLFLLGLVFLPSALPISIFFLFLALLISIITNYKEFHLDKLNILLIMISGLMIFSNFRDLFTTQDYFITKDHLSTWVDLFNWIPLFFCFWGFQSYLKTDKEKKLAANTLLISTLPVVASCIAQMWLGWYGPFSILNGLIIWFQREPAYSSVTGLFNNPNYAGLWLASMWPLVVFNLSQRKKNIFLIIYLFLITYFLILTNSRNALFGLIVSIPLVFGIKSFAILVLFFIISLVIFLNLNNIFGLDVEIYQNFIPYRLIQKITDFNFLSNNNAIRLDIFRRAINFIKLRPILGWGASLFPIMYLSSGGYRDIQHTHNINLEIAFNYGLPVSLLLTYLISIIIIKSFKLIFLGKEFNTNINKSWFSSTFVVIIYNLTDVTYYDGKFSLLSWIFLGGLKCIIDSSKKHGN